MAASTRGSRCQMRQKRTNTKRVMSGSDQERVLINKTKEGTPDHGIVKGLPDFDTDGSMMVLATLGADTDGVIVKVENEDDTSAAHSGTHLNTLQDGPPFKCSVCGNTYNRLGMLYRHERVHRQVEAVKSIDCLKCAAKFSTRKQLVKHMCHVHSLRSQLTCSLCNCVFTSMANRTAHKCNAVRKKRLKCLKCDAVFNSQAQFSTHVEGHVGDTRHTCDTCGQTYARRASLVIHLRRHVTKLSHVCDVCQASFSVSHRLKTHQKIHTERRQHKCRTCGREFQYRCKLVIHERIHSGEKPFPCNICDKAFNANGSLQRHYRVHTGERPFACTVCDDKFALRHQLLRHSMLLHSGAGHTGKVADAYRSCYPCNTCGKLFSDVYNLQIHEQVHIPTYVCDVCDEWFTHKYAFRRHKKQHDHDVSE